MQIFRDNFSKEIAGMPDYINKLSIEYPLVLYSDHAKEWISCILNSHTFLNAFNEKVFSYEQDCLKSDVCAFPQKYAPLAGVLSLEVTEGGIVETKGIYSSTETRIL